MKLTNEVLQRLGDDTQERSTVVNPAETSNCDAIANFHVRTAADGN